MTSDPTPSWLTEPCPAWCRRRHQEQEHPEDRFHQSDPAVVATVAGDADTIPITDSLTPVDLTVRLGRHVDDSVEWIAIEALESPRPRLVLTTDSARRLAREIAEQLARRHDSDDADRMP